MNRISLQQAFTQGLRGILNVQSQLFKTQDQVSSGKRVLTPADDPVAASRILQLEQSSSEITQYKKNIDGAQASLSLEDSQLDSVGNLLARVRELAVQSGDGALSQTERQAIGAELNTRLDELVSLANTRSTSGEYIFGGYQGEQAPFVQSGNSYVYRGDDGQRAVQVSSSTVVQTGDSGKSIFVAVSSPRLTGSALAGNTGGATISNGQVIDKPVFNASFTSTSYQINFTSATTYDIQDAAGATVVTGATFTSGQPIQFNGAEFRIVGAPNTADSFRIQPPSTQSIIDTVSKLAAGLNSLSDSANDTLRMQDLVSESLDNLDSAITNISSIRAQVGARQNTLDSTRDLQTGVDLVNQKVLGDVRDLDYTEAITRLTKEQTVLQAAQQSFANISKLSLFDFIR